jgi:hypothetical protein
MLPTLQSIPRVISRFDRAQLVLEILSGNGADAVRAALRGAIGADGDVAVTVQQRLTAAQGGGYLVAFQGRSLSLPLRGDYVPGQVVRLALPAEPAAPAASAVATSPSPVSLGAEARLIGAILTRGAALPAGAPMQLPALSDTAANPPPAAALKQALTESGVFYESHVAEWAQGERTIEALQREPQGRIGTPADAPVAGIAAEPSGIPDSLVPIVKEQLQAIDARQVAWRGEVWPNQTIELTIAEQDPGSRDEPTPAAWTTTMKLDLPRLGGIQAILQMQGDSLRIGMRASEETAPALQDRGRELTASLAALGLKLVSMRVEEHGAPSI